LTAFERNHIKGRSGIGDPGGMPPTPDPEGEPDAGGTFPWEGATGDTNTWNGNKLTSIPLVGWSARGGMAVNLALYHSSGASHNSEVGWKWLHSYDIYGSVTNANGDFRVQHGDGLEITFVKNLDGSFSAPAGIDDTLVYTAATSKYTLTTNSTFR
jgi:hypothetical protein